MPMPATKLWTLDELHRLPEDGNTYELVHGALFVTPAPDAAHEELAACLHERLAPYVARHGLGRVYTPRSVIQRADSQVEPDRQVRAPWRGAASEWTSAPRPILVVEIASASTRRRDRMHKRQFYLEEGIAEYWIVDSDTRSIRVVRSDASETEESELLTWHPAGARDPLTIDVKEYFLEALGNAE